MRASFGLVLASPALAELAINVAPVLGIDLGNEFFKIAAIAPTFPRDMILNGQSQRKSRTAVDFSGTLRTFGEDAFAKQSLNPLAVLQFFPSSVGGTEAEFSGKQRRDFPNGFPGTFYPLDVQVFPSRASVKVRIANRNLTLSFEEVVANLLAHAKEMTTKFLGTSTGAQEFETAMVIPVAFRYRQRQLLIQAASLAGLKVTAMIYEPLAAALSHSLDLQAQKLREGNQTDAQWAKVFLSIGARHVQACLVDLRLVTPPGNSTAKTTPVDDIISVTSRGCASAPPGPNGQAPGAHQLDVLLAKRAIAQAVKSKTLQEQKLTDRDRRRIVRDIGKAKHTLSTNQETRIYLDRLGTDGAGTIQETLTRGMFEQLIAESGWLDSITHVKKKLDEFREDAKPGKDSKLGEKVKLDFDSVELIGGGWRVPKVMDEISRVFAPASLSLKCNADESMAMGAAIVAANHSVIYKAKPMYFTVALDKDITVQIYYWPAGSKNLTENLKVESVQFRRGTGKWGSHSTRVIETNSTVFVLVQDEESSQYLDGFIVDGFKRIETTRRLKRAENDELRSLFHGNPEFHQWIEANETALPANESLQVAVHIRLTPSGVVTVDKANARWRELGVEVRDVSTTTTAAPKTTAPPTNTTPSTPPTPTLAASNVSSTNNSSGPDASNSSGPDALNSSGTDALNSTDSGVNKTTPAKTRKVFTESYSWGSKGLSVTNMELDGNSSNAGVLSFLPKKQRHGVQPPYLFSHADSKAARSLLQKLLREDRLVEEQNELRNKFESEIYGKKAFLRDSDSAAKVSTPEEREKLLESLTRDEEWLYEEGFKANMDNVTQRMKDMQLRLADISSRCKEYEQRASFIVAMDHKIASFGGKITNLTFSKPWVAGNRTEDLERKLANFTAWFADLKSKQQKLTDKDAPVLVQGVVNKAWALLQTELDKLAKLRKPSAARTTKSAPAKESSSTPHGEL